MNNIYNIFYSHRLASKGGYFLRYINYILRVFFILIKIQVYIFHIYIIYFIPTDWRRKAGIFYVI